MPQKLLIATKNSAKLNHYKRILAGYKIDLLSLSDVGITQDVAETESTFKDNAILKAQTYFKLSNLPVLAEDGGVTIPALNGWPGVHSRRVWGPENREATDEEIIQEVVKRIEIVPIDKRQAFLVVDTVIIMPDGVIHIGHGEAGGYITTEIYPNLIKGFPIRSIFVPDGKSKTVAELENETVSADYLMQRKRAIMELEPYLKQLENYA